MIMVCIYYYKHKYRLHIHIQSKYLRVKVMSCIGKKSGLGIPPAIEINVFGDFSTMSAVLKKICYNIQNITNCYNIQIKKLLLY